MNAKGTGGSGIKIKTEFNPMKRQLRKSKYASNKFNAKKMNQRERDREKRADAKTRTVGGSPMAQHPIGNFMYGQDQWGYINPKGLVDWTSTKPRAGRPVIGVNEALPYLRRTPNGTKVAAQFMNARKAAPNAYHDPIYNRFAAQAKQEQEFGQAQLGRQEGQINLDYDQSMEDLSRDYGQNLSATNAGLGAANVAGSGVAAAQLKQLASALLTAQSQNQAQKLQSVGDINLNRLQTSGAFDTEMMGQEGQAKERWQATHQGEKFIGPGTSYTDGGFNYKQNSNGIPMSWKAPAKAKKPKFPGAKTFTDAKGAIHKMKGK